MLPTDSIFKYLGVDRSRYAWLLGGQETDASCVILDKSRPEVWTGLHLALFLNRWVRESTLFHKLLVHANPLLLLSDQT